MHPILCMLARYRPFAPLPFESSGHRAVALSGRWQQRSVPTWSSVIVRWHCRSPCYSPSCRWYAPGRLRAPVGRMPSIRKHATTVVCMLQDVGGQWPNKVVPLLLPLPIMCMHICR